MENLFIPYTEAKILKEQLGFIKPCLALFDETNQNNIRFELISSELVNSNYNTPKYFYKPENYPVVLTPTWDQVFDWFREKHKLDGYVHSYRKNYHFTIIDRKKFVNLTVNDPILYGGILQGSGIEFETTLSAKLACLNKLIEIVKTK